MAIKREDHLMPDGPSASKSSTARNTASTSSASTLLQALQLAQGPLASLVVFASVLFRLLVYVFLRWIPSGQIIWPIHALYAVYLFAWAGRQRRVRKALARLVEFAQLSEARRDLLDLSERVSIDKDCSGGSGTNGGASNGTLLEEKGAIAYHLTPDNATKKTQSHVSTFAVAKAVILGQTTSSPRLNRFVLAAHSLLFLLFLDAVWSPYVFPSHHEHYLHFARVGAIAPKSATIHVRYPFPLGNEEDYHGTLIDHDKEGGSSRGALRDVQSLLSSPQPVRIVYREVYTPAIMPKDRLADRRAVHGRLRPGPKRWERGPLLALTAASDWTAAARIDNLWPSTEYEWRLAFAHNSTFTPMPAKARRFTTWPDPRLSVSARGSKAKSQVDIEEDADAIIPIIDPNYFSFASSSCVKPDFPYAPTQFWMWSWLLRLLGLGSETGGYAMRNRIPGFDELANAVIKDRETPALRFFLQLGDLIYADVPYYGGPYVSTYRKLYRNLFASESFRRVFEHLPIIGIYDDHEVINNWGGQRLVSEWDEDDDDENRERSTTIYETEEIPAFMPATKVWQEYIGSANHEPLEIDENYYTFRYGDTAFFVLDTRKHRTPWQLPDDKDKTMLGAVQRDAFVRWLGAVNSTATFKFVVSSVPFTTLWGGPLDFDGKKDSWAAYTTEREYLLDVMQYVPNIIVISGDRHEFSSVGIAPQGARESYHPITEFSTSPLSMFYLPVRTLDQSHGLGPTGAERLYKYLPDGNVKWTEFQVDTRNPLDPRVTAKVMIDGKKAWQLEVHGKPIRENRDAVGDLAKSFLELLRWRPRRWF